MNKYLLTLTVCIFIVSSCASVEVTTNNVENEKESSLEVDENQKFLDFLEADWEKTLTNNPLFACLLYTSPSPRDKRQSRMPSSA